MQYRVIRQQPAELPDGKFEDSTNLQRNTNVDERFENWKATKQGLKDYLGLDLDDLVPLEYDNAGCSSGERIQIVLALANWFHRDYYEVLAEFQAFLDDNQEELTGVTHLKQLDFLLSEYGFVGKPPKPDKYSTLTTIADSGFEGIAQIGLHMWTIFRDGKMIGDTDYRFLKGKITHAKRLYHYDPST